MKKKEEVPERTNLIPSPALLLSLALGIHTASVQFTGKVHKKLLQVSSCEVGGKTCVQDRAQLQ